MPEFMWARGHGVGKHDSQSRHDADYSAENITLNGLRERLSAAQDALTLLAGLTERQLDSVPPAGDMKFCDGQRTLKQVVTNVLNHQQHQIDALQAAVE